MRLILDLKFSKFKSCSMKLLPLILILIICSCEQNKNNNEIDWLYHEIKSIPGYAEKSIIIILPSLGCNGCIQEGEKFMSEYIKRKDVLFILTNIESLKHLGLKIGLSLEEYDNVIIDRENKFLGNSNNNIYPLLITMKDGKILHHEYQSPANSLAFERVVDFLEN